MHTNQALLHFVLMCHIHTVTACFALVCVCGGGGGDGQPQQRTFGGELNMSEREPAAIYSDLEGHFYEKYSCALLTK